MKIALIHDYLVQYGGAERVLESFMELFPRAPVYTLVYDKKIVGKVFNNKEIRTSFLQKVPFSRSEHYLFPIIMPMAVEQFDLSYYDVVLSDSSSYAEGVITKPETVHVCYCHTPMRYAWDDCHKYAREFYYPSLIKKIIPFGMNYIRMWDRIAAERVDFFIANSQLVKKRIKKYYKRESTVINPPVFLDNFKKTDDKQKKVVEGGYYLMVGRLVPYKKFDLGIKVFNELGLPLKIVGDGPEFKNLKKIAKDNVELLGSYKSTSKELVEIYENCKALIYPQEEDFGLVPLEAMALGKPVIAYRKGGALETVKDGLSGIFFDEQTKKKLIKAIKDFQKIRFNSEKIMKHAKNFGKERFKKEIELFVNNSLKKHKDMF
jgi:glycosyltransferase involved in cell wall biosynthesis